MKQHVLNKFGFKTVTIKDTITKKLEKTSHLLPSTISITKPQDHVNPQIVVKLPREVLEQMGWEITDRVTLMANQAKQIVALVKTKKKEKNSFAIATQGASIQVAKETKRGGIVKIGWRDTVCKEIPFTGTFKTTMEIFDDAVIIQLPSEMFASMEAAA